MPRKVKCEVCDQMFSTRGLAAHLKSKHSMSVDDYVNKFGEFRVDKLANKQPTTEKCLVCGIPDPFSQVGLTWHLKKEHNMSKQEYVRAYLMNNDIPLCKCGCGQEVPVRNYYPYITTEFITGHNSKGSGNPRYGVNVSTTTRQKMILKAKERMAKYQVAGTAPMHSSEAIRKRADTQVQTFIDKIEKSCNITVLERGVENDVTEYIWKCNKCDSVYTQYHTSYFTCIRCNPSFRSMQEKAIIDELKLLDPDINVQQNNRSILGDHRELDIVLPDYKVAIEFDGLYWHGELQGKNRKYHLNKTLECEAMGYQLLHIFEDEWEIHKDVIMGKLSKLIGRDDRRRIYARKCKLRELGYKETRDFLNAYHLQGADSAKTRLGLFYEDVLVTVMTFSRPNLSHGKTKKSEPGTYELSRLCTRSDHVVVGGASRLLKYFIRNYNPTKIISYADRRYSVVGNNVYEKLGFSFVHASSPNYWYMRTSNRLQRYHRFNFTRRRIMRMGGNPDQTEWENMVSFGYDRIWDCGSLKYELTLTT